MKEDYPMSRYLAWYGKVYPGISWVSFPSSNWLYFLWHDINDNAKEQVFWGIRIKGIEMNSSSSNLNL